MIDFSSMPTPYVLSSSWNRVMKEELEKPYFRELGAFVQAERRTGIPIYPPQGDVFTAFHLTPYEKVKVVILGQDPYHGPGQAQGLCFSVAPDIQLPPSLKNIFLERQNDLGIPPSKNGSLIPWAKQGVLLLNSVLTVRKSQAFSHKGRGWERFTDAVIGKLAMRKTPIIFLLWGKAAQEKCENVPAFQQNSQHYILKTTHPSPFSAHKGFLGCKHFSKVNAFLKNQGIEEINWCNEFSSNPAFV